MMNSPRKLFSFLLILALVLAGVELPAPDTTHASTLARTVRLFGSLTGESGGVSATGGTITTSGDYTIHTFTSSGTLTMISPGDIEVLVVAGGGAGGTGGTAARGGGGAGGIVYDDVYAVTTGSYTVTVGGGGTTGSATETSGSGNNSVFDSLTALGGGGVCRRCLRHARSIRGSVRKLAKRSSACIRRQ